MTSSGVAGDQGQTKGETRARAGVLKDPGIAPGVGSFGILVNGQGAGVSEGSGAALGAGSLGIQADGQGAGVSGDSGMVPSAGHRGTGAASKVGASGSVASGSGVKPGWADWAATHCALPRLTLGQEMRREVPVGEREPGWQDWLHRFKLWNAALSESALYRRYQRFSKVTFELVPESEWGQFFQDLLPLEECFVFGDAVGHVAEHPFQFHVLDDRPIRQKPIVYPVAEREWIRQYVREQCELGVLREVQRTSEPDPVFVSSVVLAREGQSQQKFRLCANLVQANARIQLPAHPMPDCQSVLDSLSGCSVLSAMDIKAAFNNVPMPRELQKYAGIVTQDGLFVYQVMAFGYNAAPCHYQHVMSTILNSPHPCVPVPFQSTYLDDVCAASSPGLTGFAAVSSAWENTLACLWRIAMSGQPISIRKCEFLRRELKLLGVVLCDSQYELGRKSLAKLVASELPATLRQLQALAGKLNFVSQFVPDYRRIIKPIKKLMGSRGGNTWTQEHTDTLNTIAELVYKRIKLGLINVREPVTLHVDADETDCSAVLVQGAGPDYRVVAMLGREFAITEAGQSQVHRLLLAAAWAVKRLSRYTMFVPKVYVEFPCPAVATCACVSTLPLRLQAKVIELTSYNCEFRAGAGAWAVQGEVARVTSVQEGDDRRFWEHRDIVLQMPGTPAVPMSVGKQAVRVYFDGGCTSKTRLGSCGHVVFDSSGQCVGGTGRYLGSAAPTNNVAEAQGMLSALQAVVKLQVGTVPVVVLGDSQLILGFMQYRARPGKRELVVAVDEARRLVRQLRAQGVPKVWFQHVPRDQNRWADWLGRMALALERGVDLEEVAQVWPDDGDAPREVGPALLRGPGDLQLAARDDPECAVCGSGAGEHVRCWGCGGHWHRQCMEPGGNPPDRGPWHCKQCLRKFQIQGLRDVTLDTQLICALSGGPRPARKADRERVKRAAKFTYIDEEGRLWLQDPVSQVPRMVPPICDREEVLNSALRGCGYPNGQQLFDALRGRVYWPSLLQDCVDVSRRALPRQKEAAKFPPPPYLLPCEKGGGPFAIWCIDTITRVSPPAPDGARDILVAVDVFTKWVEIGTVRHLDSKHTCRWFHENIVCRYGVPGVVRTDRGVEFKGAFDDYLQELGVVHRLIATMNPRANGQVERYNRTLEANLRKFLATCPDGNWWDFLPDVARGLRVLPIRATGFAPHVLVYKQLPELPFPGHLRGGNFSEGAEWTEDEVYEQLGVWRDLFAEVRRRQGQYDRKMVRAYLQRKGQNQLDVRFSFRPGDQVLRKARPSHKLAPRCWGPYRFERYVGGRGLMAEICTPGGEKVILSTSHLRPFLAERSPRLSRFSSTPPDPKPAGSSAEPTTASSDAGEVSGHAAPEEGPSCVREPAPVPEPAPPPPVMAVAGGPSRRVFGHGVLPQKRERPGVHVRGKGKRAR